MMAHTGHGLPRPPTMPPSRATSSSRPSRSVVVDAAPEVTTDAYTSHGTPEWLRSRSCARVSHACQHARQKPVPHAAHSSRTGDEVRGAFMMAPQSGLGQVTATDTCRINAGGAAGASGGNASASASAAPAAAAPPPAAPPPPPPPSSAAATAAIAASRSATANRAAMAATSMSSGTASPATRGAAAAAAAATAANTTGARRPPAPPAPPAPPPAPPAAAAASTSPAGRSTSAASTMARSYRDSITAESGSWPSRVAASTLLLHATRLLTAAYASQPTPYCVRLPTTPRALTHRSHRGKSCSRLMDMPARTISMPHGRHTRWPHGPNTTPVSAASPPPVAAMAACAPAAPVSPLPSTAASGSSGRVMHTGQSSSAGAAVDAGSGGGGEGGGAASSPAAAEATVAAAAAAAAILDWLVGWVPVACSNLPVRSVCACEYLREPHHLYYCSLLCTYPTAPHLPHSTSPLTTHCIAVHLTATPHQTTHTTSPLLTVRHRSPPIARHRRLLLQHHSTEEEEITNAKNKPDTRVWRVKNGQSSTNKVVSEQSTQTLVKMHVPLAISLYGFQRFCRCGGGRF